MKIGIKKSSSRPFLAHPAGGQETIFYLRMAPRSPSPVSISIFYIHSEKTSRHMYFLMMSPAQKLPTVSIHRAGGEQLAVTLHTELSIIQVFIIKVLIHVNF